jgi:hypothetical protein
MVQGAMTFEDGNVLDCLTVSLRQFKHGRTVGVSQHMSVITCPIEL